MHLVLVDSHQIHLILRGSYFVSIPIDLSGPEDVELAKLEEKGVKGLYASVEQLTELEDGKTEWRMAVSTHPMGNMPLWISEMAMAGTIAEVCGSLHRGIIWL